MCELTSPPAIGYFTNIFSFDHYHPPITMATPLRKLNWGIISTGGISHSFAKDSLEAAQTVTLLAVASRTKDKADAFADLYGIPRRYADYQALLDDPDVEVVYISTPHPQHKVGNGICMWEWLPTRYHSKTSSDYLARNGFSKPPQPKNIS